MYYDRNLGQWMEPLEETKKPRMSVENREAAKSLQKLSGLSKWDMGFLKGILEADWPLSLKQRSHLRRIKEKLQIT